MDIDIEKFICERNRPENTVHYGKTKRFEMAKQQLELPIVDIKCIIDLTNQFIKGYGLNEYNGENIVKTENIDLNKFNKNTKKLYKGITSEKDIVWMKFTAGKKRVGVVACCNDVNFDIPPTKEDYDVVLKTKRWKYNTSGILVHSAGLSWDESFFLVFPLLGLKDGKDGKKQRHDLETGIGNYLISKNVPIVDYFSHRF